MTDKIKKILMSLAALAALGVGGAAIAGAASGGKDTATQERNEAPEGANENEGSEAAGGQESENSAADSDNVQDENGKDDATEGSEKGDQGEHSDKPVTGAAASRAKEAARAETGGKPGVVERDSEHGAAYEVEVTKPNGQKADVRLDNEFNVVAVDQDHEGGDREAGEQEGAGK